MSVLNNQKKMKASDLVSEQAGFTLIEIIVVLVLSGMIASLAGLGLSQVTQGFLFTKQNTETAQKGKLAMARMIKELTNVTATPTITPTIANGDTITLTSQHTALLTKTYTLSRVAVSNILLLTHMNPDPDVDYILADNVTGFLVTRSGNAITVEITLAGAEGTAPVFSATVVPRNL